MNYADESLGLLARTIPGATRVFHAHHLDFCCGGKQTLRTAADKAGLDATEIAAQLDSLQEGSDEVVDWTEARTPDLVNHILSRYHARHREQLPELIRLARRVEAVHGDRPECPLGLADHLENMQQELESHMQKEEMVLFPLYQREMAHPSLPPVQMMRMEHDHHGEELAKLEALTNGITLPRGACNTWRALYLGLQTLKEDLMAHIHLENNVLFERG
ncbi:iron-sulfur cluster repair protein YtfE [Aquabacterium fontiphilum]|uniref:iron-sulfur cluster repair protein YtfE n=1 Tax=Aquabacterium fontiphilum TaxID=450365 RepID=UPI001376E29F|nr:iron-sulfur cluster repair protein YtfE [Aquabacterium fontiphilum]NBD21388.1 iron-sulfur cluster repair protein YtfE [Aquabacterium fontiphilum]